MIDFLIGSVVAINDEYIVLQNNNIGYKIYTSMTSILAVELGEKDVMMYTKLNVREDAIELYGFVAEEEIEMFDLVTKVSGIGPKTGLNILSTITPSQIKLAIHREDHTTLSKAPGIGKKTAQRMILELKDKIGEISEIDLEKGEVPSKEHDAAVEALMSLGYLKYEAEKSIRDLDLKDMDAEQIIRHGLKHLSGN